MTVNLPKLMASVAATPKVSPLFNRCSARPDPLTLSHAHARSPSHRQRSTLLTTLGVAQDATARPVEVQQGDDSAAGTANSKSNENGASAGGDPSMDSIHSLIAASQQLAASAQVGHWPDGTMGDSVSSRVRAAC